MKKKLSISCPQLFTNVEVKELEPVCALGGSEADLEMHVEMEMQSRMRPCSTGGSDRAGGISSAADSLQSPPQQRERNHFIYAEL